MTIWCSNVDTSHGAEQEAAVEVADLDLSSKTLSRGGQRTSASTTHQSPREPGESQRAGKRLHDERGAMGRAPSAGGCMTSTGINDSGL